MKYPIKRDLHDFVVGCVTTALRIYVLQHKCYWVVPMLYRGIAPS